MKNIVIVGGGVSGLYAAYKLSKHQEYQITVLEKLNRLGGRIITENVSHHTLEYGPMRFEPELQQNFAKLLEDLGIKTTAFSPYTCPSAPPDFNKIRLEEIQAINKFSTLPPAFALLKHALINVLDEQWDVLNDSIHAPGRDVKKQWLKRNGTFQGRYLHEHGLWDTLAHVLSKEALDYMRQKGTFYHMLDLNPNAADQICFMLDILATANTHLITLEGGSYTIIEKLRENISSANNVCIRTNVEVVSFDEDHGVIKIFVLDKSAPEVISSVIKCNHLVFTCQKRAYKDIQGFDAGIRRYFDSVMVVKLYKIFVLIDNPPFDEHTLPTANFNADKIPCREIHYSYDTISRTGMIMIYGDVPTLNYWKPFIQSHNTSQPLHQGSGTMNTHIRTHLMHYLRCIFSDSSATFSIRDYGIMDWSNEPYRTGVHLWKPGYCSQEVIKKLQTFGESNNIHVCGETFSDYQGFIEGSLRTVDSVVNAITSTCNVISEHNIK